ncbi:MAG: hypothetical protein DHS80DRAFT_22332 [Piptocephalis tieghemiana]|nr:MAG: hypothetical protein DHS80DRAFT_22332 [Piptocephalis tieghemiana]
MPIAPRHPSAAKKTRGGKESENSKPVRAPGARKPRGQAAPTPIKTSVEKKTKKSEEGEKEVKAEEVKERPASKKRQVMEKTAAPKRARLSKTTSSPRTEEEESQEEEEEEAVRLAIGDLADSSEGEDSSEDEEEEDEQAIAKSDDLAANRSVIALQPKEEAKLKQRIAALAPKPSQPSGVLYLGRIPHGFYETEMRAYFGQFGDVVRLRLSRNRKTGRSKHFAFIEFGSVEVAEIVADTMNNYLLFGHLLQCKVIPPEKVHPDLFAGCERKFRVIPFRKIAAKHQNKAKSSEEVKGMHKRLLRKEKKKREQLKKAGINYTFPGYEADEKAALQRMK